MDIRYFALCDWVEQDLMILDRIDTSVNEADHLTKILDRTLFYRHVDHLMGRIPPLYSPCHDSSAWRGQTVQNMDITNDDLVIKPVAARAAKSEISMDYWTSIVSHANPNSIYMRIGLWGGVGTT